MTYDRILLPWLTTFWRRSFAEQRFRFASPSLVERELQKAVELAEPVRAQAILLAMATGLGLTIDPAVRKWIEAAKADQSKPSC